MLAILLQLRLSSREKLFGDNRGNGLFDPFRFLAPSLACLLVPAHVGRAAFRLESLPAVVIGNAGVGQVPEKPADGRFSPMRRSVRLIATLVQFLDNAANRKSVFYKPVVNLPDDISFIFDNAHNTSFGDVAKCAPPSDEKPLSRFFIASPHRSFPDLLAFILGDDAPHIEKQSAFHAVRGWSRNKFELGSSAFELFR
jgi:hypothetical protein